MIDGLNDPSTTQVSAVAKLQELRERREKLKGEIETFAKELNARRENKDHKGPVLTPEQRTAFDKLKADYVAVKAEVEAEEGAVEVQQFLADEVAAEQRSRRGPGGRPDPLGDDPLPGGRETYGDRFGGDRDLYRQFAVAEQRRALAFSAWAIGGQNLSPEQRTAVQETGGALGGEMIIRGFDSAQLRELRTAAAPYAKERRMAIIEEMIGRGKERRSVVAGTTAQANLAPQVSAEAFEKAALTIGGLYNAADVKVTQDGTKMTWPTGDDTSNEGKQIDEVTAQALTGVAPTIAAFSLASFEFWSDFIRVGNVTLRDSPVALATEIGLMIGERIARIINRRATNGNGTDTLRGIELNLALGHAMATATTYAWGDLYKVMYSVDQAYRDVGSWMMNDEILVECMLLTDDEGRPLLIHPNDGSLPRLLNRPVVTNNHMATKAQVSTTRPSMIYGDLKKYKLRLVRDVRTSKLVERFAEFDQVAFDGKRGADGGLLNAGGNPVKCYRPAA